jgi:adenosine deaminase
MRVMPDTDWREALRRALAADDIAALRRVPKADVHSHGLLSAPRSAYEGIVGRALPEPPVRFADFAEFGGYIMNHLFPAISNPAALRSVVRAALERAADDGVVYTEINFDLFLPDFVGGLTMEAFGELIAEERRRIADRLTVKPEIGINRTMPVDEILPRLRRALASGVWRSIDLYDDERIGGSLDEFVPVYRLASEHGLKLKAHAGELTGAEWLPASIEKLGLDAVQHGIRAVEDESLVDLLAERGTVLNICPTSNFSLRIVESFEEHPAHRLHRKGVKITVNTDDHTLFGVSASEEILNLKRMGFEREEIVAVVENGLNEAGRMV